MVELEKKLQYTFRNKALLEEALKHPQIEVLGPAEELPFDENGNLF